MAAPRARAAQKLRTAKSREEAIEMVSRLLSEIDDKGAYIRRISRVSDVCAKTQINDCCCAACRTEIRNLNRPILVSLENECSVCGAYIQSNDLCPLCELKEEDFEGGK